MKNVGSIDRVIRVILGIAILSLLFVLDGGLRYLGVIGLIPLVTGLIGYCPLYALFKASTNKAKK